MPSRVSFLIGILLTVSMSMTACGGGSHSAALPNMADGGHHKTGTSPIQHIVVLVQENRTFNNLFATFKGTTGTTTGLERIGKGKQAKTVSINLAEVGLVAKRSLNHMYSGYRTAYRNGHMDAFNLIKFATTGQRRRRQALRIHKPGRRAAVLDDRNAVRHRRYDVPDARQRQLHRAPGFDSRRHRDRRNR